MEWPTITRSNFPFSHAWTAAENPTADSTSNPSRESISSLVCNNAWSYEMDSILGIRTKYLLILRVTGGFRYSMNEIILAALNVLENQKSMEPVLLDRLQLKIG
jgi:hypothetical protein